MSNVRNLIDAIDAGDSVGIETAFEAEMASRIADRLDAMRASVAASMFAEDAEETVVEEEVENLDEKLVGDQHKIDANKNGKIDAHDFKLLRKKK